jgi:hypothetical protein
MSAWAAFRSAWRALAANALRSVLTAPLSTDSVMALVL